MIERPTGLGEHIEKTIQPGAGNLGLTRRSYERLYLNARQIMRNVRYLVDRVATWVAGHVQDGSEHRRIVSRFIMTETDLTDALNQSDILSQNIEAVIPVGDFEGTPIRMVMFGVNRGDERTNNPVSEIEYATHDVIRPEPHELTDNIDGLRERGVEFVDTFDGIQTDEILSLWGPIFEWTTPDIDHLRLRLQRESDMSSEQRSVWMTAAVRNGELISLAMAERLNLPIENGEVLSIVESTEWCVRSDWQGNGVASATVSHVHAQVLEDLATLPRAPIVVAETNFTSRAHATGSHAGMIVAEREVGRHHVSQVLRQNVGVGDGLRPERLRDFTFMYLDRQAVFQLYSPAQRIHLLGRDI